MAALSSPVCSSKSKAWIGFKKSSAELLGSAGILVVSMGLVVLVDVSAGATTEGSAVGSVS